jgi:ATP-binding protein involved in chromosome partitioning
VLLVDLPPGTGDVALTIAQKVPVSGGVTVTTPQNMSLVDAKRAVDMFERTNVPVLGLVENMSSFTPPGSSTPLSLFPKGDLDAYLDSKGIEKLGALPFEPKLGLCSESGIPMVEAEPESTASKTFQSLAKRLVEKFDHMANQEH